jgi:hypothetical protein
MAGRRRLSVGNGLLNDGSNYGGTERGGYYRQSNRAVLKPPFVSFFPFQLETSTVF